MTTTKANGCPADKGPERIYLQPLSGCDLPSERRWREDDCWSPCGVQYIRSDIVEAQIGEGGLAELDDRPLTAEENRKIDEAWEKHKAAAPWAVRYPQAAFQRWVAEGGEVQPHRVADHAEGHRSSGCNIPTNDERAERFVRECERYSSGQLPANLVEELSAMLSDSPRVKELERLVYVPGLWRCEKCDFELLQSNLNACDGSVTARDEPGDKCPNCNHPLSRVTERKRHHDAMALSERFFEESRSLRSELAAMTGKFTQANSELVMASELLRSAFQIALREGKDTNWLAFKMQVEDALNRQQAFFRERLELALGIDVAINGPEIAPLGQRKG